MSNIVLLAHIAKVQNFQCIYCGIKFRWPRHTHEIKPTTMTKEHLHARCHNGTNRIENLAAACSRCNNMRGHLDVDLFQAILDKLFTVEFIRQNWHTTNPNDKNFIRKIFQYEVDAALAWQNKQSAVRAVTRRHYSIDELTSQERPFTELVPTYY